MGHVMSLTELLTPDAVFSPVRANGKKALLQDIAERAATLTGLPDRDLFELLLQRERLGSTGIGDGIAIPHCRMMGLQRMVGLLMRMDRPVDFESLDGQPVDLIFVLLAPDHAGADHLKALARIARLLRDRTVLERLRTAHDAAALYAIVTENQAQAA
jgi:PTS system nitrogen regulatory IIA component